MLFRVRVIIRVVYQFWTKGTVSCYLCELGQSTGVRHLTQRTCINIQYSTVVYNTIMYSTLCCKLLNTGRDRTQYTILYSIYTVCTVKQIIIISQIHQDNIYRSK